jgi:hypothetical protein
MDFILLGIMDTFKITCKLLRFFFEKPMNLENGFYSNGNSNVQAINSLRKIVGRKECSKLPKWVIRIVIFF